MKAAAGPVRALPGAVEQCFREEFGEAPALLVRAPGRVNLIGEHTDYNDGFVLPLAIDRAVWLALRPRTDRAVHVRSLDFHETLRFRLDEFEHGAPAWGEYVRGTAWSLARQGHELRGWEGVLASDVPIGAGLSSSAALELAVARAFAAVSRLEWDPATMAMIAQQAENGWVGMQCGIMDQLISAAGVAGHAVLIDCRSLALRPVPLPPATAVVILDTATRRGLVGSAYNERRAQCREAAAFFGVRALRDVTTDALAQRFSELEPVIARRCRHVVTENARTVAAADAMARGDAAAVGRLMDASHDSLRDDYEVSSPALDTIVDCARAQTGCHGARMTGAGFGGCAVALVARAGCEAFSARVAADYLERTGRAAHIYITGASGGAAIIERAA